MFDFTDQVVLVAGASGNLGGAVAHAFHAARAIHGAAIPVYARS